MQSIDSIETYAYETSKDLASEKEEIKCNNIIKRYKNINFDVSKENVKEHYPKCPQIHNHPYRMLITRSSGSGKKSLINLINQQPELIIFIYKLKIHMKQKINF